MTEKLTPFIAPLDALASFRASPSEYHAIVLMQRDIGDDEAVLGVAEGSATGEQFAYQLAKELQLAYDDGMAGRFQILRVADDLGPQILGAILPASPLSPWQCEFASAYCEGELSWIRTLADAPHYGDTIFTAVMVELDAKEGCDSGAEAVRRLDMLIDQLTAARDALTV
ncbi:hypothetical protein KIKIMORA_04610 [Brevundimonas phage vB_BpoS-Kikimora]|uniref:Uncharacterized protein n=1 Tax=Brevundimonas phage vB_BpoS-Kikimora TaxID=2948601 RepID=A0A9E7SLI4_9CAUD|nr:hypothetical protein KIKIMORA_04610 [Brevundimonas phage vB_BpoS-Kikimora]